MGIKRNEILKTVFDQYTIIEQIGQGGNGTVYSAKNGKDEKIAVKVVDISDFSIEKKRRLKNEIYFCLNAECENILKVMDYGLYSDNKVFYIMPLGICTLRDRMKRGLKGSEIFEIFIQLLKGIKYAHDKGVFHRDLKPENILFFDNSNKAVLADFGIAHFSVDEMITIVETEPHSRMANFQYAAPEQREKGRTIDGRTDMYSLGLILNEMFTGQLVAGNNYKKISEVDSEYGFLDDIFDRLYCQNPDDRLFPAETIIMETSILAGISNKQQDIDEIKKVEENGGKISVPKIISLKHENGKMIVELSHEMPAEWFRCLTNGQYEHQYVLGYDTDKVKGNGNQLMISVGVYSNESTLGDIVRYLKVWLMKATTKYVNDITHALDEKRQFEIQKRNEEIKLLQKEQEINEYLSTLI